MEHDNKVGKEHLLIELLEKLIGENDPYPSLDEMAAHQKRGIETLQKIKKVSEIKDYEQGSEHAD